MRPRQRGQALAETLVVSLALLPMFLAIPLLAKYSDIRQAAIEASRSAAFDCTVRPDDCDTARQRDLSAAELHRAHFADPADAPTSRDALESAAVSTNRFWVDRRQVALLDPGQPVRLSIARERSDAIRGAFGEGTGASVIDAVSRATGPDAFGLPIDAGLIRAEVEARVSVGHTLAQWMDRPRGLQLRLRGRTSVLTDAWNASQAEGTDARSVRSRVDRGWALPAGESAFDLAYAPIRSLIVGPLLAPVEPRGRLFRYHEVDVDLVPPDRLEVAQ
ncbi:MAG: hypothetical protein AB7P21_03125 [Lautropia sp.]